MILSLFVVAQIQFQRKGLRIKLIQVFAKLYILNTLFSTIAVAFMLQQLLQYKNTLHIYDKSIELKRS